MKVLIVDDSMVARSQIKKAISEVIDAVEYEEANTALSGITKLKMTDHFDVITVDFNMPGGTGDLVVEQAKVFFPDAKIALITANKQSAMKDRAEEWGVKMIEKPHFQGPLQEFVQS